MAQHLHQLGFEVVSSAMSGEPEPVKQAFLTKYDINARDLSSGGTALHAVASALALDQNSKDGHQEIVRWLLENGIDYTIKDNTNMTAEDRLAEAKGVHEAAKALDVVRRWKERNAPSDQEARRHNLRRDSQREVHGQEAAERLLRACHKLHITVKNASQLRPADSNGLADPYVKLIYGRASHKDKTGKRVKPSSPSPQTPVASPGDARHGLALVRHQKFRTKTQHKTLNPVWNEQCEFEVNFSRDPKGAAVPNTELNFLRIEVWDKDSVKDDFLGYVELELHEIAAFVGRREGERTLTLLPDQVGRITLVFDIK